MATPSNCGKLLKSLKLINKSNFIEVQTCELENGKNSKINKDKRAAKHHKWCAVQRLNVGGSIEILVLHISVGLRYSLVFIGNYKVDRDLRILIKFIRLHIRIDFIC